jgi:hypothetical protein
VPKVEISNGELADKWTILNIKQEKLKNQIQINNITIESEALILQVRNLLNFEGMKKLIDDLYKCNLTIWHSMEDLYKLKPPFDQKYVEITVLITKLNQRRALLKNEIDKVSNSKFTEAKSFFENKSYILDNN